MNRQRWLVTCAGILALASTAGVSYAWLAHGDAEGSASRSIAVNGTREAERALLTVSAEVGFDAEVPSFFPTSATRLVLVDSGAGPGNKVGGSLALIEQIYESDQKFTFKGREIPSAVEIFQLPVRLSSAQGERLAVSNASFEIYRHVVDTDGAGAPVKVTYTALGVNKSFVMDFTGEQPSDAGVVKMLDSFRAVPKQPGP